MICFQVHTLHWLWMTPSFLKLTQSRFWDFTLIPYLHGKRKYQIYWTMLDNRQVYFITVITAEMHCYNNTHTLNYHTCSLANNNYACTRRRLHNEHFFTYYASIMLDAFLYLLCSKLCWYNWRRPIFQLIKQP